MAEAGSNLDKGEWDVCRFPAGRDSKGAVQTKVSSISLTSVRILLLYVQVARFTVLGARPGVWIAPRGFTQRLTDAG